MSRLGSVEQKAGAQGVGGGEGAKETLKREKGNWRCARVPSGGREIRAALSQIHEGKSGKRKEQAVRSAGQSLIPPTQPCRQTPASPAARRLVRQHAKHGSATLRGRDARNCTPSSRLPRCGYRPASLPESFSPTGLLKRVGLSERSSKPRAPNSPSGAPAFERSATRAPGCARGPERRSAR